MPSRCRSNKSRRPRRRQIRRPGPPLAVARVSFMPGTTSFRATEYTIRSDFQGYQCEVPLKSLLEYKGDSSQNILFADSRLVSFRVVLPPNTTNVPLGCDVLLKGFPLLDSPEGTVVGRTTRFLSLMTSTVINCRLPPAVRQQYINSPEFDTSHVILIRFRYYADKPSTAATLPAVTLEMKFRQQPIETYIAR